MNNWQKFLQFFLWVGLVSFSGCADYGELEKYGDAPDEPDINWVVGETHAHEVNVDGPTTITDETTGLEFYFPTGGDGVLEVGWISEGPEPPLEGQMFYIDYDGPDQVLLKIPVDELEMNILSGFGTRPSVYDDEIADNDRWLEIPATDTLEGYETFDLYFGQQSLPKELKSEGWQGNKWNGFKHHHITAISKNTDVFSARIGMHNQMKEYFGKFLSVLTPANAELLRQKWYKSYRPDIIFSGNHYTGVLQLFYDEDRLEPIISLSSNASYENLAHELGHNIHHLLCSDDVFQGDEVFMNIFSAFPQPYLWQSDSHEFGHEKNAGLSLLEDYAYFLQYFLTGQVGVVDLFEPFTLYNMLDGQQGPEDIDYPRMEGFGAMLMGGIVRNNPKIAQLDAFPEVKIDVPVIAKTFREVIELIYPQGIITVDDLRDELELLTDEPEKLQVIAQRYGWRYMAKAKIFTEDGQPVKNKEVEYYTIVDGKEYAEKGFMTNDQGEVEMTRCFGGDANIRIIIGDDTISKSTRINWELPTNKVVDLGYVEVKKPIELSEVRRVSISLSDVIATLSDDGAHEGYFGYTFGGEGSFFGEVFNFEQSSYEYGVRVTEKIFIRVDSVSGVVRELKALSLIVDDYGNSRRDSIYVTDLEFDYIVGDQITFISSGVSCCKDVKYLEYSQVSATSNPPWSSELIHWACSDNTSISVDLYTN